jgi:Arc/MetJ-type ribon-helix-helix transcriptional regulator
MPPPNDPLLYELEDELHDLCQPLTALQFRLELGKFVGDSEALREAVDGALEETNRMIDAIKRMRERLTNKKEQTDQINGDMRSSQPPQNMAGGVSH